MQKSRKNLLLMPLVALLLAAGYSTIGTAAERSGGAGEGIFSSLFGGDYKVTGGSIYVWSEKKAVLVRNYATILLQGKRPNEWRRIRARNIIFFTDTNKLYAEGNVSVEDSSGTYLNCDNIYFDNKNFTGRARNVRLRSTDEGINKTASVEEKDVSLGRPGLVVNQASPLDNSDEFERQQRMRMNLQTPELRIISKDHFQAVDVTASPSNYARPHWAVHSGAVNIRRGEKVEGFNNVIKIGNMPVFYLPYIVYDLKYRWPYYRTTGGSDNRMGYYWLNRVGWIFDHPTEDEQGRPIKRLFQFDKIFVDADIRLSRGFAWGAETEYTERVLGEGSGDFRYYGTVENLTGANEDVRRAREDTEYNGNQWGSNSGYTPALYRNKSRYLIEWWHRHKFSDDFDLRLQTHSFSDRDFYKEYFRDEWNQDQEKLTNASLRFLPDLFSTELLTQMRINDFRTESEYLPEWRFNLAGLRLGALPIFVESQTNIGMVRKSSDVMLDRLSLINKNSRTDISGDTPWIGRAHNLSQLAAPVDLGPVNVNVHGGGRMTGYTNTYNGNYGKADEMLNLAAVWGVDLSSRYYGYFKNNTLRHMLEPTINVIGDERPTLSRSQLYSVDEIDEYVESHRVKFGLYQDFQTKDKKQRIRRLFDLNVSTAVILDQTEADTYNLGSQLSNVYANAGWYPTDSLALYGYGTYSPGRSRFDTVGGGFDYWFSKKLRLYLNHVYSAGSLSDPEAYNPYDSYDVDNNSQLTTLALRSQLWNKHSHYSVEYALSYQWCENANGVLASDGMIRGGVEQGLQSQRISLIRDMDTFDLSLNWIVDQTSSGNNKVSVGLTPKNWLGARQAQDQSDAELDNNYGRYANPIAERAQREDTTYNAQTPAWDQ